MRFALWVTPALLVTVAILVPFGMALFYSLTNRRLAIPGSEFVGFENYVEALPSAEFRHALGVTVAYAVLACTIELPLGIAVAYLLNRDFRFSTLLRALLILPLMIPPVIAGLVWQLLLNPSSGLYTLVLDRVGVEFRGFASSSTALLSVLLVDVWIFTPFVALIVLAGLRGIPAEPLEAASVDGARESQQFRFVVLPLLVPVILLVVIFRLVDSLRMFDVIYVTTQGGPGDTLMTLALEQYVQTFQFRLIGASLPYTIVLWLLIFVIAQILVPVWMRAMRRYSLA